MAVRIFLSREKRTLNSPNRPLSVIRAAPAFIQEGMGLRSRAG